LLKESPATGYRVRHAIGIAVANTYKALTSLEQKGAVIVENGENGLCLAASRDRIHIVRSGSPKAASPRAATESTSSGAGPQKPRS